ncbi:hypothetical protein Mrad2831_6300 (plasmid) [Methylobacterium radiotolerans JCM 2831]|uniref:Peptidase S1 domain-containing protein n=2 Tax=Methylobacterium radiotolerans TaxID=31998 RepID=B1M9P7_METRJ|nr:hypothetical protein Mrad2831_6300 [Methylobacterium radiotolerans JCM 2831]
MISGTSLPSCFAAILSVAIAGTASAASQPTAARLLSAEQAREVDAQALASASKITTAEARQRLAVQRESRDLVASLRSTYGNRIAGIYREWTPSPRLVVRLKGASAERVSRANLPTGSVEVVIKSGARFGADELKQAGRTHAKALRAAFPTLGGTWVDERTGELVVEVASAADVKTAKDLATVIAGVPARVVVGRGDFNAALSGSGALDIALPNAVGHCTGGFTVNIFDGNDKTTGLATAGHCPDGNGTATYTTLDGLQDTLTLVGQDYDADSDVKWYTKVDQDRDFEPTFYSDDVTKREVSWYVWRDETVVGDSVCKYGQTSGASCGVVASTSYAPADPICNGQTCAATYVMVEPVAGQTQFGCASGDSGGPVFNDTTAYGILKGCGDRVGNTIYAQRMFYTALDALAENDVYVFVPI